MQIKGKVTFQNIGPGIWGILGDNGEKYQPIKLAKKYQKEGLFVQCEADLLEGVSVFMWGKLIKINKIQQA